MAAVCWLVVSFSFYTRKKNDFFIVLQSRRGDSGPISSFFLFTQIVLTTTAFTMNGFQGRRSLGFFLISNYMMYLLICILCEAGVMHPYGTGHTQDGPHDHRHDH